MNNSFDCPTCHNSGRVGDRRGSVIPCPHCERGAEYRRQSASQPGIGFQIFRVRASLITVGIELGFSPGKVVLR